MLPTRQATSQKKEPLIRYVNLTINNPLGQLNKCAEFDTTYARNILNNAGENTVGIVNMSIPLQELPLFIFPVTPGNANSNLSVLQVGICNNLSQVQVAAGTSATVTGGATLTALTWIPQEMGLSIPDQTSTTLQTITDYYYCYSFEHFANLVNIAMTANWVANGSIGGAGQQPYITYSKTLNTFTWTLPAAFQAVGGAGTPTWSVCWNESFDNLMNNFNTVDNSYSYQSNGLYILENVKSATYNTDTDVILSQDYATVDAFNTASRIVILTSSIPIATDFFPSAYDQLQSGGLSNEERILADLPIDFDNNIGAQRSTFVYEPTLYQLSDLESTLPMRRISVKIKWADSLNNFYDIPLAKGDVVTVKLGFFNKGLNVF